MYTAQRLPGILSNLGYGMKKIFLFLMILCFSFSSYAENKSLAEKDSGKKGTSSPSLPLSQRLVNFISHTVNNLQYTSYKLGGNYFDTKKGVYILDCSAYVDKVLKTIHPDAYFDLVDATGSLKPTTLDYYTFFKTLTPDFTGNWNKVTTVEELEPGDIVVFRYKNQKGRTTGGHVMVVMETLVNNAGTYVVRVADAAEKKHSADTRYPRTSGIGMGTLALKVNTKTGQPYAYAWSEGAKWVKNVNFAMARPIMLS
jgi:hypothetical protein